jgi:hypothetical protein
MKSLFALLLLLPFTATLAQSNAEDKKAAKQAAIKNMVEGQNYVFQAQQALPLGGRTRQLTTEYDLKVTKESITSYLPYFGRAYTAPIDPTKGGIQFTSKDFDYTLTPNKKDGWTAVIKPKDNRDVQQMTLNISSEGYTSLQVTSVNRQPISFSGIVVAPKH